MRKIAYTLVLCLAYFTGVAQWNTDHMLRSGRSALVLDDYVSAIENFNHIIRVKPYLPEPYFFRGLAKLSLDDFEGAVLDFSEAIALDPNYLHAYAYRGIARHHLKKYEEAIQDYNTALSINPTEAYIYANRAITWSETGDHAAAERDYAKALIIDNKLLAVYLNRAISREGRGDRAGALADCNEAIELHAFSDEAYGLRGYLKFQNKQHAAAIEDYNRALKVNPLNKRVLMSRAIAWYEMLKFPEALADYTRVLEIDSTDSHAYYNRALLRAEIGEYNNAIDDLNEVLKLNQDNILVYFNRGLLRMETGDREGARDDFSESISLYPDFVNAYLARAEATIRDGNPDSKAPDTPSATDREAAARDRAKAREIMERYQRMKEGDRNALVDTTENFRRLVDFNAREDRVKEVINGRLQDKNVIIELQDEFTVQYLDIDTLRKGRVQYFNKHLMAYNQEHNYQPALTISNKYTPLPPEFLQEQIEQLSRRLRENNEDTDALLLRGGFYLHRGEYTRAIEDFKTITEKHPDHLLARFNLANARVQMYDYIESVQNRSPRARLGETNAPSRVIDYSLMLDDYQRCLDIDPAFLFATFNVANVRVKNGDIDLAIQLYTRVIEQDREIAEAYYNRGLLYIYKGETSRAVADLGKAGELGLTDAYSVIKRYGNTPRDNR
ncbi:MAG: tetratricopeptide repeat protein [Odoribacteraceae bacterium]|jgi:tetratricopeptide (TPR) repeat protein|nr:tetratricopeptide repeat protein [Odoribacteraceae bacterium]